MRAAPAGHVAPVATCTAIAAWLQGDGVRANAALERALEDDREYALGWLVAQSIMNGLPPQTWRGVMSTLSESDCRAGVSGANQARSHNEGQQEKIDGGRVTAYGGGAVGDPLAHGGG